MPISVGKAIRVIRDAKGVSLAALAEKTGLSASFLSLVESGGRNASIDTLELLAKALDVPVDFLVLMATKRVSLSSSDDLVERLLAVFHRLETIEDDLRDAVNTKTE